MGEAARKKHCAPRLRPAPKATPPRKLRIILSCAQMAQRMGRSPSSVTGDVLRAYLDLGFGRFLSTMPAPVRLASAMARFWARSALLAARA